MRKNIELTNENEHVLNRNTRSSLKLTIGLKVFIFFIRSIIRVYPPNSKSIIIADFQCYQPIIILTEIQTIRVGNDNQPTSRVTPCGKHCSLRYFT